MTKKTLFATALACILTTACATVTRGPNVKFHIVTDPEGGVVTTDLKRGSDDGEPEYHECEPTPCYIHVSRRSEFVTTVTKEGYHPATVEITSGFGKSGSAVSATGTVAVAASAYVSVYTLYTGATLLPALLTGSSLSSGAAAASTQAATGFGVIMLGVDLASGAMLDVRPNPLILVLIPEDQPIPEKTYLETKEELEEFLKSTGRELPALEDTPSESTDNESTGS